MSPNDNKNPDRVEFFADAKVTGNVIERGEGYIVVPILVTMEDVFDYDIEGKKTGVIKRWDEIIKVDNFDGTPFIAHHPVPPQTQEEIPAWGKTRNTRFDEGLHCVSSELVIDTTAAPERFVKDAEEGKLQPISWGFAANRVPEDGIFNSKKFSFADCNMTSRHVAYAPPPWTARCKKCATNTSSPIHDAEGGILGEEEADKKTEQEDALSMGLLPEKIDELLLLKDDFDLGRQARVLLAQLRATMGEGNLGDAKIEGAGEQKPAVDDKAGQADAGKPEGQKAVPQDGQKEGNTVTDAEPKQQATPDVDPLAKLGEILDAKLDAKLTPVLEKIKTLEDAENARKTTIADAELKARKEAFDANLTEAGKAENKDGKLFDAFDACPDKFTWMREHDAAGHIAKVVKPGQVQGSDALPPQSGDDSGRKSRVAELGKKYYPNADKKEGGK